MKSIGIRLVILLASALGNPVEPPSKIIPNPIDGRIVGGCPTLISEHPHQISLRRDGEHLCGGSIISQTKILTAAHCIRPKDPLKIYSVLAGTAKRTGCSNAQLRNVSRVARHPKFNNSITNNIAILLLQTPLYFWWNIYAIKLPPQGASIREGSNVIITGWGRLHENYPQSIPITLQAATMAVISNERCNIAHYGEITADMLCAGPTEIGCTGISIMKGACHGDDGGPLVFQGSLYGIISWGRGCARPKYPTVFVRVSYFTNWINNFVFN